MGYTYTSQQAIRQAFWESFPNISNQRINYNGERTYTADTRAAFVDFVDSLQRDGAISDALADRVTLD